MERLLAGGSWESSHRQNEVEHSAHGPNPNPYPNPDILTPLGGAYVTCMSSRLGLELFAGNTGHVPPMALFFPAYDDAALHGVLVAQRPAAACATKYGAFVQPVLASFGRSCRNLHELRTLCAALWPKYLVRAPALLASP